MADLRQQLVEAGERRATAREDARLAMIDIAELTPAALEAGVTKSEVCRLAGISWPTLETILRERATW